MAFMMDRRLWRAPDAEWVMMYRLGRSRQRIAEHTFDATAVLENSKLLAATPHWMRKGDHTAIIGSPMDRAGVDVPHPAPAKPHLSKGRPLGAAVGNGGDAKLPKRLRIDW